MSARYPVNSNVPHNAIVRYNPFTQLFLIIRQVGDTPPIFLLIIILVIFILTGRGFCGWLCPVGTGLDIYNRFIGKRFRKHGKDVSSDILRWKYRIFLCCVLLLLFGVSLYWLFDPASMFVRNTALVIDPVLDTAVRETTRGLSNIPNTGYAIERTMRSIFNPMPVKSVYLWLFLILLVLVFLLEILALRFFCKVLCPLGALIAYFSNFSPLRLVVNHNNCTQCNRCPKVCKTHAISSDENIKVDNRECIFCLSCIEHCSFNALNVFVHMPHLKGTPQTYNRSRRDVVFGLISAAVLLPVFKFSNRIIKRPDHLIRPPGALPENVFSQVCAKCGSCMKVCYTSGIQPTMFENGLDSLFTPRMDFEHGFCGYECNDCGKVCPTGAIVKLPIETKRQTIIGMAKIDREICWPWGEKKPCLTCEEVCPIHMKAIELEDRPVIFDDGFEDIIKLPHVVEDNCIGCGICVYHCPTEPVKAIQIVFEKETRGGEYRDTPPVERREHFVTDDPVYWND